MLVIVSDIHLWDGTLGLALTPQTFSLFASRLRELAFQASWRKDGSYRPIDKIDILLLGDIIDPLQSSRWFAHENGDPNTVRVWDDPSNPAYSSLIQKITHDILTTNEHPARVMRELASGHAIQLPPADRRGKPAFRSRHKFSPQVRLHYMVGNHDWYYNVRGAAYDDIRQEIIDTLGLFNTVAPFPHTPEDSVTIKDLLDEYRVVARHGDIFDRFSYNPDKGRSAASLSDIFSQAISYRISYELPLALGDDVPPEIAEKLGYLPSVRPAIANPIWIRTQVESIQNRKLAKKVLKVWDQCISDFLDLPATQEELRQLEPGSRTAFKLFLQFTKRTSVYTQADIVKWMQKQGWGNEISIAKFARREKNIHNQRARYVVYGHTHSHEVISLDKRTPWPEQAAQVYINSGSWSSFYDISANGSAHKSTSPSHLLTCLAFYKDNERGGKRFETWWGNFS